MLCLSKGHKNMYREITACQTTNVRRSAVTLCKVAIFGGHGEVVKRSRHRSFIAYTDRRGLISGLLHPWLSTVPEARLQNTFISSIMKGRKNLVCKGISVR